MNPIKMAKVFNAVPEWQNFAKSGHTGFSSLFFFTNYFHIVGVPGEPRGFVIAFGTSVHTVP